MSSISEKDTHRIVDDFDYGDDVSIIDRSEKVDWSTIIIKICLGLLFIGFATGCIIYSILTSKEYEKPPSTYSPIYVYDVSQHCDNGTLQWTNRTGSVQDYDKITTGIAWLQDSKKKRIYHRIGIAENDKDWKVSHFVFSNHTFFVDQTGCTRQPYGYDEYLRRMGFQKVSLQRVEGLEIEEKEVKANLFEGEPAHDIIVEGTHPTIIRAYAATDNSFAYAWEYVFAQNGDDTGLFMKDYWFPDMKAGVEDESVFEELPSSCYKANS